MPKAIVDEFLASRKAAGEVVDVETCEIWDEHCIFDPYGRGRTDEWACRLKVTFVRSAESEGPVCYYDLPEDKRRALDARIKRENQVPTTAENVRDVLLEEHARAVARLDEVIDYVVDDRRLWTVPHHIVWSGVCLALEKLGKQNTPQQARLSRKLSGVKQEYRAKPRIEYDEDDIPL